MTTTYETSLSFTTEAEALAHLALFGYVAMPLRNRWTNRSVGDFGEARIGFASIDRSNGDFTVHETDMPLKRG